MPKSVSCIAKRLRIDEDVGRLDVLVDDVARMDSPERLCHLARDNEKRRERKLPALEVRRQRDAAAFGEDEDIMAAGAHEGDSGRDARVFERAREREFPLQPRARLRSRVRRVGDFDDDLGPVGKTRRSIHGEMSSRMQRLAYSKTGQLDHFVIRLAIRFLYWDRGISGEDIRNGP